ncbi:hypothetical protein [Yinghuangia sp. YIM S09857]|uniref:hypothetical protein n=1 Tax=Yinghuangia sp. YIM S09857 TaxID=3436929 RepID=UPI003F532E64
MLAAAVLGSLALTACEMPGKEKDKADGTPSATASASVEPSDAAPSTDAREPAASPSAGDATGAKPSGTKAPSPAGTPGPRVLLSAARTGGYERLVGEGAPSDMPVDPGEMTDENNLVVVAYGKTPTSPREVLFVGVDGLTATDGKRMEHMIRGMIDYVNGDGGSVPEGVTMKDYAAGPLGGTVQCMPAQDAYPAAICAWADKNTVAVAYFDKLSADAAAKKLVEMRTDLEK